MWRLGSRQTGEEGSGRGTAETGRCTTWASRPTCLRRSFGRSCSKSRPTPAVRGVGSATVVPAVERGLSAGGVRAMKMSKSGCAHLSCSTAKRAVSSSSLTGGKSSGARRDNFPHRASTHLYCTMAGMATRSYLINRSNPSSPSASFAHWYASAAPPPTPTVVRPRARRSIEFATKRQHQRVAGQGTPVPPPWLALLARGAFEGHSAGAFALQNTRVRDVSVAV